MINFFLAWMTHWIPWFVVSICNLDLLIGYWQVEVDEKDCEKIAFTTPEEKFTL